MTEVLEYYELHSQIVESLKKTLGSVLLIYIRDNEHINKYERCIVYNNQFLGLYDTYQDQAVGDIFSKMGERIKEMKDFDINTVGTLELIISDIYNGEEIDLLSNKYHESKYTTKFKFEYKYDESVDDFCITETDTGIEFSLSMLL